MLFSSPSSLFYFRTSFLTSNFNKTLRKTLNEMRCWERLRFEVPHFAGDVYQSSENLRVLRESVMLIVRDYNRIVSSLPQNERFLFKERIRTLDKKIRPGMVKLTWASEGILEYVTECRLHAQRIRSLIDSYKDSNRFVSRQCRQMSLQLMVKLDEKRVYEEKEYVLEQQRHRNSVQKKLHTLHEKIVTAMKKTAQVRTLVHCTCG